MVHRGVLCFAVFGTLLAAPGDHAGHTNWFEPANRLSGIGVDREQLSELVLTSRTGRMVDSMTFSIMRDARAVAGAQRITSPRLQTILRRAAARSGLPASLIEAVAYLESWGDPRAESPSGPRGIMQISEATGRSMGLRVKYGKRYKVTRERVQVRRKGRKPVWRTVRKRTPYTVLLRDDRLYPDRAVPAAASYLARLEQKFGGRDWAVFAYHCGEGCAGEMMALTERARGVRKPATVAQMFFLGNPVYNRELYDAISRQMRRDYSPTYWFRVMRAQQLLQLWREDPGAFRRMAETYRSELTAAQRAPHRLSVWLRNGDLNYRSCEDIISDRSGRLARALDDPEFFGYTLRKSGPGAIGALDIARQEYYLQAAPSALGTLIYIAYETRKLHAAMGPHGERWVPIEVTSLVEPMDYRRRAGAAEDPEFLAHCTGHVFDINVSDLPPGQREALDFVLDDIGWAGYLGFVEEAPGSGRMHVGCAPSAREFFTRVFEEAMATQSQQPPAQVSDGQS